MTPDITRMRPSSGRVLITGGAGFIGTNLAARLASDGRDVIVFDNLSRPGVERNLEWLYRSTAADPYTRETAEVFGEAPLDYLGGDVAPARD